MSKYIVPLLMIVALLPLQTLAEGLMTYKPPQIGVPQTRVGGGTRSFLPKPKIQVLAPRHAALTSHAQPVLYWYCTQPNQETVEITLIKDSTDLPLLKKQLLLIAKAGLQSIRLADYGVSLRTGEDYHWSVAVINNSGQHLGESVATATIRYQLPITPLTSAEQQAEAGYWYDALQQLIESHSPLANNLLKQIGIQVPDL
jgi:hypothetical protein